MKKLIASIALVFPLSGAVVAQDTVFLGNHEGQLVEFLGLDDLHLDPATVVIAVDLFGDADRVVNGVTFFTDGQNTDSGTATNTASGVGVTTTRSEALYQYLEAPEFTGVDQSSADNLAQVMWSVRYAEPDAPMTIDIEGLISGALYEVQLLGNEGEVRVSDLRFDVAVNGELVVDNLGAGMWTANNSFAYVGNFQAPADGKLSFVMRHQIGGQMPNSTEYPPGFQGVVVHLLALKTFKIIELKLSEDGTSAKITWLSVPGQAYAVDWSADLVDWQELDDLEGEDGETTSFDDAIPPGSDERYYRVREAK